jgi:two-component system invasion response regulator UvrY
MKSTSGTQKDKNPIRFILVDDHDLVRKTWRTILEENPDFTVVADCDNGNTAIELAQKHVPDIMLVDIDMAPVNGFVVAEKILESMPSIKIIGLSINNTIKVATKMLKSGASGYLTKTTPLPEAIHGIMEVYKGNIYICDEIRKQMPPSE